MCTIEAAVALLVLAVPSVLEAHRLDELLQATRIGIAARAVDVELDLSPGADVAGAVIGAIDTDRDNKINAREADAYAAAVLRAVVLTVDGGAVPLHLVHSRAAPVSELRGGVGSIRIVAAGPLPAGGRHHLRFANQFTPAGSAYLVNALTPVDAAVHLGRQSRDVRQQTFTLDYDVAPSYAWAAWSGGAFLMVVILVGARRRPFPR